MAVPDALIRQVGSILGFIGDIGDYARPDKDTIARWLLEGQQYLAAELVPDAIPDLWRTTIGVAQNILEPPHVVNPGLRVVRVKVGSYEARHISLKESLLAEQDGSLFVGTVRSPKWWVEVRYTSELGHRPRIQWAPEGADADITYVFVPEVPAVASSGDIFLGAHFHPALVDWALARARHADDDDAGAGAARAAVRGLVQSLNALHGGRQAVLAEPGARD